jgi:hypothetical protein
MIAKPNPLTRPSPGAWFKKNAALWMAASLALLLKMSTGDSYAAAELTVHSIQETDSRDLAVIVDMACKMSRGQNDFLSSFSWLSLSSDFRSDLLSEQVRRQRRWIMLTCVSPHSSTEL